MKISVRKRNNNKSDDQSKRNPYLNFSLVLPVTSGGFVFLLQLLLELHRHFFMPVHVNMAVATIQRRRVFTFHNVIGGRYYRSSHRADSYRTLDDKMESKTM